VAEQTAVAESSEDKVVLDKADLPIPEVEEETEVIETPSDDEQDEVAAKEPLTKPKPKPKTKIIIMAAAVLALIAGGACFFFLRGGEYKEAPLPAEPPLPAASVTGPPRATLAPFIIPIPVNPQGRLLRAVVMLEFVNRDEMQELMNERLLLMRDIIYRSLHNRSAEDLNRLRANEALSSQIKAQLNNALGREAVKQVYFPDFLFAG
jgi:flagellar basal body-associated protein FliL